MGRPSKEWCMIVIAMMKQPFPSIAVIVLLSLYFEFISLGKFLRLPHVLLVRGVITLGNHPKKYMHLSSNYSSDPQ